MSTPPDPRSTLGHDGQGADAPPHADAPDPAGGAGGAGGGDAGSGGGGAGGAGGGGADGGGSTPRLTPYLRILRRMVRRVSTLFRAHAMVVRSEAEREIARVLLGVAFALGALIFLLATALLLAIGAVVLIQRVTGLPWLESVGLSAAGTASVAALSGLLAWLRLRRPLMPESRKLLQSTLDGLLKG